MNRKNIGFFLILAFMISIFYESKQLFKGQIFAQEMNGPEISENEKEYKSNLSLDTSRIDNLFSYNQLEAGWKLGSMEDFFEQDEHKISWDYEGPWSYTYNDVSWNDADLEAVLLVDGDYLNGNAEFKWSGFLWSYDSSLSTYSINFTEKKLKRSFIYEGYQIDIIQHLLEEGSVEITYEVTNLTSETHKIGVSQFVHLLDDAPISVTNDFKGISLINKSYSFPLAMLPDLKTMPNWVVGTSTYIFNFGLYSKNTSEGLGWETGKDYYDENNQILKTPKVLSENKPMSHITNTGITMKNPGVNLLPGEKTAFKQTLKYGGLVPPNISVDQPTGSTMYTDEQFELSGTISDRDNRNYRLYLQMDDEEKKLILLKDYENKPLNEVQDYQATIKGELFTPGSHSVSIVGIDEYGMRSELKKLDFMIKEISGTPQIQKVKVGEYLSNDVSKLFKGANPTAKLKEPISVNSTIIGFQWVEAMLTDSTLHEKKFKIPVSVYDPKTTKFDDTNHLALDVKDMDFGLEELVIANRESKLDEYITKKITKIWRIDTGEENPVDYEMILSKNLEVNYGKYEGTIAVKNSHILSRISKLNVVEPLDEGWEIGSKKDFILDNDYQIEWKNYVTDSGQQTPVTGPGAGSWWYKYKGKQMFYTIGAALIINENFLPETSDSINSYPKDQRGFLWKEYERSFYSINRETKSLKRSYRYLNDYKIEIIQQLLENNAAEITYRVTNLSNQVQDVGVSQNSSLYNPGNETEKANTRPISGFKGVNIEFNKQEFMVFPDPETMPNWTIGEGYNIKEFNYFDQGISKGKGWETGKRYRDDQALQLPTPIELRQNEVVKDILAVNGLGMKNPGVTVAPMKSASFKQVLKYGSLIPPNVTLDQNKAAIYQHESFEITGEISDEDNKNYELYLEMDDEDKTMVKLKEFTDIPYKEIQPYHVMIEGQAFSPGKHTISIIGVDEYGSRSVAKKIELTIKELNATPAIQKVKIGEQLSDDLDVLFQEIRGENVTLKKSVKIDSGKIGFQWVEAVLTNGEIDRTLKIPVNVYNSESTHFNNEETIALDAKNTSFGLAEVEQAGWEGTLNELVRTKVAPLSWDMTNGTLLPVELTSTDIQPVFGSYVATFNATNQETGEVLEKESQLMVGGELKFKEISKKLGFKDMQLSHSLLYVEREKTDWKIEIENTVESQWKLYASAGPFESQGKENSKISLVFKDTENNDVTINHQAQVIASGNEENYSAIQWDQKQGLLLKVNSDTKIGVYQSEINWTLSDAPG